MSRRVDFILVQQLHLSRVYFCASEDLAIWERVSHYLLRIFRYII